MIGDIRQEHYEQILKMNAEFVHWLAPLDRSSLETLLGIASHTRQIDDASGVLIGYGHEVDYDNKNIVWLRARFPGFYYIDRVIIDADAHGQGFGRRLYDDFEHKARLRGHTRLVCEVNTTPNNPASHKFHERLGFCPIGDVEYPQYKAAVRYYEKRILP